MPAKKKASPRIPSKPMSVKPYGLTDFFIREKANEGIDVPLALPNGEDSGHTICVRGIDSDHFKKAQVTRSRQNLRILAIENEEEQLAETEKADTALLSSLVAGWSFPEEFNETYVVQLLTENPVIRSLVDGTAAKRSAFFGKR